MVFATAFALRLIATFQYLKAPDFDNPIGDSAIYLERARGILAGDLLGSGVYFYSSPLYPYFMAFVFRWTEGSFLSLRVAQAALGALGCVIISLLARRLAAGSVATQLVAGLLAACYATLVFFDIDVLMISLTILLVGSSLLLLLRSHESGSKVEAGLAGIALGLAASDKPNLLLVAPVAAWFLAGSLLLRPGRWCWRRPAVFAVAVAAMILPITARNFVVGRDLVLVSSNSGVNLYIGNNEHARGTFALPVESGLTNIDLQGSSAAVAEQAAGRSLRPSEVSRFWATKAWHFAAGHPLREVALIGLKLRRLVSAYEVPNHLSLYYMSAEFLPVLNWLWVGAGLVFPLGLVGAGWRLRRGATPADRLLCGYMIAYALSLLPFFVTERYRLPLVPVLLVYAAALVTELPGTWSTLSRSARVTLIAMLSSAVLLVHWPAERFGYAFDRVAMATKYFDRGMRDPVSGAADRAEAIIQLKWALETDPYSADAHYNLGVAYESAGYYSGAVAEFQRTLALDAHRSVAAVALDGVREKLARRGDRSRAGMLPETPYERASALERNGDPARAEEIYLQLVHRDPFHFAAYDRLGQLYSLRGDHDRAARMLRRAVELRPESVGLAR